MVEIEPEKSMTGLNLSVQMTKIRLLILMTRIKMSKLINVERI